jgi:hypothetical protein
VALYAPFDDAQTEALHAAADRHGRFLGLAATVQRRWRRQPEDPGPAAG